MPGTDTHLLHTSCPSIRVDDWVFGVSSVSADGYESPVASAVPGGAFRPYSRRLPLRSHEDSRRGDEIDGRHPERNQGEAPVGQQRPDRQRPERAHDGVGGMPV